MDKLMGDNGWFIPDESMSGLAQQTFMEMMNIICTGGQVDVIARKDGKQYMWQCDGLKYATRIQQPYKHRELFSAEYIAEVAAKIETTPEMEKAYDAVFNPNKHSGFKEYCCEAEMYYQTTGRKSTTFKFCNKHIEGY